MAEFDDVFGALGELVLKVLKVALVLLIVLLVALIFFKPGEAASGINSAFGQVAGAFGPFVRNPLELFALAAIIFALIFIIFYKIATRGSESKD